MAVGQGRLIKNKEREVAVAKTVAKLPDCIKDIDIYLYDSQPNTRYRYMLEILHFVTYIANELQKEVCNLEMKDISSVTSLYLKKYFKTRDVVVEKDGTVRPSSGINRQICWTGVNTLYKFLLSERIIDSNPCDQTKRPKLKDHPKFDCLEKDEVAALFEVIRSEKNDFIRRRDMAVIALALETGLRASALASIMIEDIDMENHLLTVVDKGEKIFQFVLSDNYMSILERWLEDREERVKDDVGFLFLNNVGKPISYDNILKIVKKHTKEIGRPISPHKLRSTYARIVYDSEKDIVLLKDMMQHSSINTTQRYVQKLNDESTRKRAEIKRQIVRTLYSERVSE